jgi:hypothetical protein
MPWTLKKRCTYFVHRSSKQSAFCFRADGKHGEAGPEDSCCYGNLNHLPPARVAYDLVRHHGERRHAKPLLPDAGE